MYERNMRKQKLVQRITNIGQEIIDRAEEIATGDLISNLDIHAYLDMGETQVDTISWSTEVISKNSIKIYTEKGE